MSFLPLGRLKSPPSNRPGEGAYRSRLSDLLNNPDKQFLPITNAKVEVLPERENKWEAPFLAINKSVVTIVRAIKE